MYLGKLCRPALLTLGLVLSAQPMAHASPADVIDATAVRKDGTWTITATVAHADTGWEHYADRFEVLTPYGVVLATRVLAHPHVDEQPFTRSISGVRIPDPLDRVMIRANDNLGEGAGAPFELRLPKN